MVERLRSAEGWDAPEIDLRRVCGNNLTVRRRGQGASYGLELTPSLQYDCVFPVFHVGTDEDISPVACRAVSRFRRYFDVSTTFLVEFR